MVGGQAFTNIYIIGCAPPPVHNLNFSIGMPCRPFHAQTKTTDQVSCPPVPSAHSQVDPAPAGFKGSPPLTTSSHAHVHEWRNVDSEHAQPLGPLCVIFSSTCIPRATSIMEAFWILCPHASGMFLAYSSLRPMETSKSVNDVPRLRM